MPRITVGDVRHWMFKSKRDWDGNCQAFVWNITQDLGLGGPSSYSAFIAGNLSAPLNPSHPRNAPLGAYVYWGGIWSKKDKQYYGHVGIHMGQGVIAMGSGKVTDEVGVNVGFVSYDKYQSLTGLPYRGWSMTNNRGRFPMEDLKLTPIPEVAAAKPAAQILQRSLDMAGPIVYLHLSDNGRGGKDMQHYIFDVELDYGVPLPDGTPAFIAARAFGQDENKIPTFANLEGTDMLRNLARKYRDARAGTAEADRKRLAPAE
jgi:hypothetical protein